jgi:hypothetical protein
MSFLQVDGGDSIDQRARHATAVVDFDIYVIGGYRGGIGILSTSLCFNAVKKTCRKVAPMNVRR